MSLWSKLLEWPFTEKEYLDLMLKIEVMKKNINKQQQEKPKLQIEHFEHFIVTDESTKYQAVVIFPEIKIYDHSRTCDPIHEIQIRDIDWILELLTAVKANLRGE